jgi:hypothetical protein
MYIIDHIDFNIKDTKNIKYIYVLIYMDVIQDITVIEKDIEKVSEDCKQINCSAAYQAIEDTIKLIIEGIACFSKYCKPKKD